MAHEAPLAARAALGLLRSVGALLLAGIAIGLIIKASVSPDRRIDHGQ